MVHPIITQSRIQGPLSAFSAGSWTIPSPLMQDMGAKSAPTASYIPEWDGIDLERIDAMMTSRDEFDFSEVFELGSVGEQFGGLDTSFF